MRFLLKDITTGKYLEDIEWTVTITTNPQEAKVFTQPHLNYVLSDYEYNTLSKFSEDNECIWTFIQILDV